GEEERAAIKHCAEPEDGQIHAKPVRPALLCRDDQAEQRTHEAQRQILVRLRKEKSPDEPISGKHDGGADADRDHVAFDVTNAAGDGVADLANELQQREHEEIVRRNQRLVSANGRLSGHERHGGSKISSLLRAQAHRQSRPTRNSWPCSSKLLMKYY